MTQNSNMEKILSYIDGEFIDTNNYFTTINPSTEKELYKISIASKDDIDRAVKAAHRAYQEYKNTTLEERIKYILEFKQSLINHKEEFIKTITDEMGSPKKFAEDVHFNVQLNRIDKYIEEIKKYEFEIKTDNYIILRESFGVCALFTPWNYPLGQIIQKVIPALLTGNTVCIKPSRVTPKTAYLVAKCFSETSIPKGVVNLLLGRGNEIGDKLSSHPLVRKVSFTGSTDGGRAILAKSGLKKTTMELGGKSPALVLNKDYIKIAAEKIASSIFLNSGQTCSSLSRAIVLEELYDEFVKLILEESQKYTVGEPNSDNLLGPVASQKQYDKIIDYLNLGKKEGASLVLGEENLSKEKSIGYYIQPSIFTEVKNTYKIAQEEIFGPVLCVIKARDIDDAINIANESDFGLFGAVFAKRELAIKIAKEIYTGGLTINESDGVTGTPFGGYKDSGYGREGGKYGIDEYVQLKSIEF